MSSNQYCKDPNFRGPIVHSQACKNRIIGGENLMTFQLWGYFTLLLGLMLPLTTIGKCNRVKLNYIYIHYTWRRSGFIIDIGKKVCCCRPFCFTTMGRNLKVNHAIKRTKDSTYCTLYFYVSDALCVSARASQALKFKANAQGPNSYLFCNLLLNLSTWKKNKMLAHFRLHPESSFQSMGFIVLIKV